MISSFICLALLLSISLKSHFIISGLVDVVVIISSYKLSNDSSFLPRRTIFTPILLNSNDSVFPMPLLAPVIKITLFFMISFRYSH